jgi:hypothetical protein
MMNLKNIEKKRKENVGKSSSKCVAVMGFLGLCGAFGAVEFCLHSVSWSAAA